MTNIRKISSNSYNFFYIILDRNHKGASLNSLNISEMSLTILSYVHVLCQRADLLNKKHFSRYSHPHIVCMCSKAL